MPSPEVAFACGSRSTTSARSPASARHAARLIVVVVLPTPPFWFANAKIFPATICILAAGADGRALDARLEDHVPGRGGEQRENRDHSPQPAAEQCEGAVVIARGDRTL